MDIFKEITDRIIAELEKGTIPWRKPWKGGEQWAVSHATGKPYSLLNQLILGEPGEYITFNQCKAEGGHIKKGAKARYVTFWRFMETAKKDAHGNTVFDGEGNPVTETFPILKYFNVFHIRDCEGITARWSGEPTPNTCEPIEAAETALQGFVERSGVTFNSCTSARAFYSPAADAIVVPELAQFDNPAKYYSTAFHEATHSTGHPSRLNRFAVDAPDAAFGSESYSKEELVAELGAAFILTTLGIDTHETFTNSAAYIQGWLKALKNDKRLIVSAASKAEKAAKLILNLTD